MGGHRSRDTVLPRVVEKLAKVTARGHASVVDDARNPTLQVGGAADGAWDATLAAGLVLGRLRHLSWQLLLTFLAMEPDLAWLVDAL